jgi:hypothetical protein
LDDYIAGLARKLALALEARDAADAMIRNLREQLTAALAGADIPAEAAETRFLHAVEKLRLSEPDE